MAQGRWPANVILAPDMARALDEQSGTRKSPGNYIRNANVGNNVYGIGMGNRASGDEQVGYGDEGGASRFFLSAWYEPEELAWIYAVGLTPYGQE